MLNELPPALKRTPQVNRLFNLQFEVFPGHENYLRLRFRDCDAGELAFMERLATDIAAIIGEQARVYAEDYRWMSEMVLREEIEFRRTGRYRLSTFEAAEREVYSDRAFMGRYMNGLLMSQLWWRNHTQVMRFFQDLFLPGNQPGYRHLEIGPGHGLFLALAARDANCGSARGWDVSQTSLDAVRHTFKTIALKRDVTLELMNMFEPSSERFDSVMFLGKCWNIWEEPGPALDAIHRLLAPGGRAFINAPVNSPAPDHLTLFRTPEEIVDLVLRLASKSSICYSRPRAARRWSGPASCRARYPRRSSRTSPGLEQTGGP